MSSATTQEDVARRHYLLPRAEHGGLTCWYLRFLGVLLVGYAGMGKGFAYVGVAPIYVGEIGLLLGMLVLLRFGRTRALLASVPSTLLAMLVLFGAVRAAWDFRSHGMMALHDSVTIVYGIYGFVVIALLLENPQRLTRILDSYSRFVLVYGYVGIMLANMYVVLVRWMPIWPSSGIPLIYLRLGEVAVHLAGAASFVLLGLRTVSVPWAVVMTLSVVMVSVSRGAMLASIMPILAAALLSPRRFRILQVLVVVAALFLAAYAAGIDIPLQGGRSIGPVQLVDDVESMIGQTDAANLDGTRDWRLNWWHAITDYTFRGPYFWTGKGFGVNLAEEDGFVVGKENGDPPVRSPHDVQMTMLARTGVPGLVLWLATLAAWFGNLAYFLILAKWRRHEAWAAVFAWIACYGAAAILDSSFDVAMEGPMIGIWFWCIFGFGVGATMIYRASLRPGPALPEAIA